MTDPQRRARARSRLFATFGLPVYRSLNQSAINWQAVPPRLERGPTTGARWCRWSIASSSLSADIHFSPLLRKTHFFPRENLPPFSPLPQTSSSFDQFVVHRFNLFLRKEIVEIHVKSHGSNLSSIEKKRESRTSFLRLFPKLCDENTRGCTRREARSGKCNQIYSSFLAQKGLERSSSWLIASMLESREGFRSRGSGKRWKTFFFVRNIVFQDSPGCCETRDISIPAKYYSIGSRNFLLYPGQVAESFESRVYFEWIDELPRDEETEKVYEIFVPI